ncbi:Protein kinase kin1 [Leucoagaricus sp. SymC.cos]|nr:Protein kinase kin1 [Leucoagaricus sp. SymC.cos]
MSSFVARSRLMTKACQLCMQRLKGVWLNIPFGSALVMFFSPTVTDVLRFYLFASAECKHLLSRMLVTNPANRATLHEVLNHPWMLRGHSTPPDPHLVHREPLRADELDRQVIRGMQGFEFGTEEEIERRLVKILESEGYIRAAQYWERKRGGGIPVSLHSNGGGGASSIFGRWGSSVGESFSNSSLAISFESSSTKLDSASHYNPNNPPLTPSSTKKSRRFSGFDYYRRKLFSPSSTTSPPTSPQSHSPPGSQNHLLLSGAGGMYADGKEPPDPTKGFHPLISMYYLAREKMERDRVYGPGQFASSQLSILDPKAGEKGGEREKSGEKEKGVDQQQMVDGAGRQQQQQQHGIQPHYAASPSSRKESLAATAAASSVPVPAPAPPATGVPTTGSPNLIAQGGKPDYSMPLPRLPAPDPSHYSSGSYDPNSVVGTTASPTTPTFLGSGPQPRARDLGGLPPPTPTTPGHGHGQHVTMQPQRRVVDPSPTTEQGQGVQGGVVVQAGGQGQGPRQGLPRAPPVGAHRRSHSLSQRPTALARGWGSMFGRTNSPAPMNADEYGGVTSGAGGVGLGIDLQAQAQQVPRTAGPEMTSFAMQQQHEEREREERHHQGGGLVSGGATLVRKFGSLLVGGGGGGRSAVTGVTTASGGGGGEDARRKSMSGNSAAGSSIRRGVSPRPSGDALKDVMENDAEGEGEGEGKTEKVEGEGERGGDVSVEIDQGTPPPSPFPFTAAPGGAGQSHSVPSTPQKVNGNLTTSVSQPIGSVHRRAATILDPQGRRGLGGGAGHERRSSMGGHGVIGVGVSTSAGAAPGYTSTLPGAAGGGAGGKVGRVRRPSTGYSMTSGRPALVDRLFPGHPHHHHHGHHHEGQQQQHAVLEGDVEEGGDGGFTTPGDDEEEDHHDDHDHENELGTGEKEYKPVYLKGLFSVATTSSKSPVVIKADIRRVLDRMQVQYREMRSGFECIHSPSIDLASVAHPGDTLLGVGTKGGPGGVEVQGRPSIVKKASKLSFGMKRGDKGKDRERERERREEEKSQVESTITTTGIVTASPQHQPQQIQGRPSAGGLTATPSSGSSSFFNVSSNQTVVASTVGAPPVSSLDAQQQHLKESSAGSDQGSIPPRSYSPVSNKSKVLPPIPRDFATTSTATGATTATAMSGAVGPPRSPSPLPSGEVGREVFESIAKNSLSVRFEINIVKVPWLPLHGIQFRRTSGDGWQYQMLARRVLTELKL